MDHRTFDSLTRSLATARTRRGLLGSLAALGAGLLGARAAGAQVTQAQCGNVVCYNRSTQTVDVACNSGCVCCVFGNGNSRCMPPGGCTGTIVSPTTTTTTQAPTTAAPTTTTQAPTTTTTTSTTQAPTSTTTTTTAPTSTTTTTTVPPTSTTTTTQQPTTTTTTTTTQAPSTTTTTTTAAPNPCAHGISCVSCGGTCRCARSFETSAMICVTNEPAICDVSSCQSDDDCGSGRVCVDYSDCCLGVPATACASLCA